jgi:hypothetical protein
VDLLEECEAGGFGDLQTDDVDGAAVEALGGLVGAAERDADVEFSGNRLDLYPIGGVTGPDPQEVLSIVHPLL